MGYLANAELFGFELVHRMIICDEPERNGEAEFFFFIYFEGLRLNLRISNLTSLKYCIVIFYQSWVYHERNHSTVSQHISLILIKNTMFAYGANQLGKHFLSEEHNHIHILTYS
jgi:hypothetical protein